MRRRPLLAALSVGLASWLLLAAPLAFAAQQRPGPVVHFRGTGAVPLVCTSIPDRTAVEVGPGQWLNVVNQTGVNATVVAGHYRLPVGDGRGRSLRLRPGDYVVTMRPSCLVSPGDAHPVAVHVTTDALATADPSADPGRTPGSPEEVTEPAGSDLAGKPPGELLESEIYDPPPTDRLPSISLLGVIAAICVFGVTASIIRAIVAQSAVKAVARHRLKT
jgi:hypothetical protein